MADTYDTLIVGGGPAGMAAGLVLGRCLRKVLVCDAGQQRNRHAQAVHALPGHEGRSPQDFLASVRAELRKYKTITLRDSTVTSVEKQDSTFVFTVADGSSGTATTLLIATGLVDTLPDIPGIQDFYGVSVHHCLYCDGIEHADRPLMAFGKGDKAAGLALMMSHWSKDVTACCEGEAPSAVWRQRLADHAIPVIISPVKELVGASGKLKEVSFADGTRRPCEALFFSTGCTQGSQLAIQLGCRRDENGVLITDPKTEETTQPGVFIAGDATKDVLLVAVAIGEGAKAGVAINRALLKRQDLL